MIHRFWRSFVATLSLLVALPLNAQPARLGEQIAAATLVKTGQPAPSFECRTTDGRAFSLTQMRGKVVLLYFFSSTTPFALTQMRYMEQMIQAKIGKREDFMILAVARGMDREQTVRAGGENGLSFALAADPLQEVSSLYFTKFVPRALVIDRGGAISWMTTGSHEFDGVLVMQEEVARALARSAPSK